jgi:general secretion pathway protein G
MQFALAAAVARLPSRPMPIAVARRPLHRGASSPEIAAALAALVLLGSFAVPAFNGYVERGRTARAVSDIGTISLQLDRWQRNTAALPATLAEAGIASVDPWGRPYVYLRIADAPAARLRKSRELTPLNADFDLYSYGPDGLSEAPITAAASRDDIVRARNGSFIGVAQNY